jgi:serine/threonine protein kinase/tetratricopeptide (TPR) repeat protein
MDIIANRYVLHEELGKGSMGTVYRATDRLTGDHIALKRVLISPMQLAFTPVDDSKSLRLSLTREFQTLASIRHPHIISVLDYGFDEDQHPFFTMTLLDEPRTIQEAAIGEEMEGKINLLLQLLEALAYLHRRGILHRDLKPANVLVEPNQNLRVLDFGLATPQHEAGQASGTIAYMAPEVLMQERISEATDLFAVGVMAYEMFAGQHPFDMSTVADLMRSILHSEPDFSLIADDTPFSFPQPEVKPIDDDLEATLVGDNLVENFTETIDVINTDEFDGISAGDLPERRPLSEINTNSAITLIISQLLAKNMRFRYQQAHDVIQDFSQVIGQTTAIESEAVRESYLQAAKFVGREKELQQLQESLQSAVAGKGDVWLVGGESGVGKSRLLDELRIQALVSGATVVRGQSVMSGGVPYQLWREPLRRLVLSADISDNAASVLKEVIPDIGMLLGHNVPDAPVLQGKAKQQRLILTMVDVFRKQEQPVLLLLEDLHWSGLSLEPLRQLIPLVGDLSVLVVASYRDDERPDLPNVLPTTNRMKLARLAKNEIAELSVSMLGDSGKQAEVLNFLQRETEGNVFFMVETVRALAEEAGRLQHVGDMQLPQYVFAGGVQQIIRRRLDRVPEEYRPLLKVAAIAGRTIEIDIITTVDPEIEIDFWLGTCANVAVLDLQDGRWQFVHDKLREALVNGLEPDEKQNLHRQVAIAIEQVHPNDKAQARTLMEHWHQASNVEKEIFYGQQAGEYALTIGNSQGAIQLFERVLKVTSETDVVTRSHLLVRLGKAYANLSDYQVATQHFNDSLRLAREGQHQGIVIEALNELSFVSKQQGANEQAQQLANEALALSRQANNQSGIALALKNLGIVLRGQGEYDEAKKHYEESLAISEGLNDQQGMAVCLNNLGLIAYFQGDYDGARRNLAEAFEIHKTLGARFEMAAGLDNMGVIAASSGDLDGAKQSFAESLKVRRDIGNRSGIASALNNMGVVAKDQQDFDNAHRYFEESLEIYRAIGDRPGVTNTLINLGIVATAQGRRVDAYRFFRDALAEALELNTAPDMLEALVGLAELEAHSKSYDRALRWLGLARNHQAVNAEIRRSIETVLEFLHQQLDGDTIEAKLAEGQELELNSVVQVILSG